MKNSTETEVNSLPLPTAAQVARHIQKTFDENGECMNPPVKDDDVNGLNTYTDG